MYHPFPRHLCGCLWRAKQPGSGAWRPYADTSSICAGICSDAVASARIDPAQVGSTALGRVLHRLRQHAGEAGGVVAALESPDDAAIIAAPPEGHITVQVIKPLLPPLPHPDVRPAMRAHTGSCMPSRCTQQQKHVTGCGGNPRLISSF